MKVINYVEKNAGTNCIPAYYKHFYPKDKILFFDIETTGFSAKNTTLYLIGALWYDENTVCIRQWFNDDGYSEKEIICAFNEFCTTFTHLIHFNGLGFDIPYLKQKASILSIPFQTDKDLKQIDILKEIRSYKNIFALDNMKQISIEQYLGIDRKDTYTGKELIRIYQKYIAKPNTDMENLLLLHNHDDLLGMPQISQILHYKVFFENTLIKTITADMQEEKFILHFTIPEAIHLSRRLSLTCNGIHLNAIEQKATLYIPVLKGTLKHYFADYKNYFYLPLEDTAIHKSIATYVEAANKIKATKQTCYIKKDGDFIPCPDNYDTDVFSNDLSDKQMFQTLESIQNGDYESQKKYIKNTLRAFL